ncbi:carboxypeptidase S [Dentipellis sp. KUC8613]|nr:carboxypeptidase S [Dentipellis sp. KUC8613]
MSGTLAASEPALVPIWSDSGKSDLCPQVDPIAPSKHAALAGALDAWFQEDAYKLWAYEGLGGAIRIPTEIYDDIGKPGEDPRWNTQLVLHDYLEQRFPLVHAELTRTKVNTFALVYHWQGTNPALKPVLLTAHQDVVPVDANTVGDWIHPPYSGYFDGEWIWGRGSCDDKSGLIGSMTAVESLLKRKFKPERSVVLAYGIDEERGGRDGATAIRDYLLASYGENAFSILVDEGGGYSDHNGVIFSSPSVAEKGKLNVRIEVTTLGGHSSQPLPHTSIGYLSALIKTLEDHPLPAHLYRNRTYFRALECSAAHDPGLSSHLRNLIADARTDDTALAELETTLLAQDERGYRAILATTQAVDLIGGGVKVNALPESAWAVVDHRIADWSSVESLQERYSDVLSSVVADYNLTFDAFGKSMSDVTDAAGHVRISDAYGTALNPAPVTPTGESEPWKFLSGTILSTLGTSLRKELAGKRAVVAPGMNLDTRHYWNLTKHIFRYGHRDMKDGFNGAHTINEAIQGEEYLEMIRFFSRLILNADETDLLE